MVALRYVSGGCGLYSFVRGVRTATLEDPPSSRVRPNGVRPTPERTTTPPQTLYLGSRGAERARSGPLVSRQEHSASCFSDSSACVRRSRKYCNTETTRGDDVTSHVLVAERRKNQIYTQRGSMILVSGINRKRTEFIFTSSIFIFDKVEIAVFRLQKYGQLGRTQAAMTI